MELNKKTIALLLTDSHCGKENIPEFQANWQEAINICHERGITHILFLGDLVLSRSSQTLDILLAIYDVFEMCRQTGILLPMINGNHCKKDLEALRGYADVFASFSNVRVIDSWGLVDISETVGIGMISYFPENGSFIEKFTELERSIFSLPYDKRILMLHQGIMGGLSTPNENDLPAKMFHKWDYVFVGHYHNRAQIRNTKIEYIGSSRQHNFGEDEMKGYTVLYNDGSTEFIQNKINLRFKVIDVDADQVDIHLTDLLDEMKADGHYRTKVRVHTTSARASSIPKEKLLTAGASKVEIITEETEAADVSASSLFEKFDTHKIRETYEEFCREKEIAEVELGLSYLSKIDSVCGN